jgi:ParB family chromosome partitioning protein
MPIIIREMDDYSAMLLIVDSNLDQREKLLPIEQAHAYRMMMEALNHSGIRGENHTHEIMEERTGIKKSQLFRIIRLTELVTPLIDKVDAKQLAFNPAVELSYLSLKEQNMVVDTMEKHEVKPSLSQAIRLKKISIEGKLTAFVIEKILREEKKPVNSELTGNALYRNYFPKEYSQKQMDEIIVSLLRKWKKSKLKE